MEVSVTVFADLQLTPDRTNIPIIARLNSLNRTAEPVERTPCAEVFGRKFFQFLICFFVFLLKAHQGGRDVFIHLLVRVVDLLRTAHTTQTAVYQPRRYRGNGTRGNNPLQYL